MKLIKIQTLFLLTCITLSTDVYSQYIPFCENGKWGFSTKEGNIVVNCEYEEVDFYSDDNLAKVKKNGKYGYINKEGKIVIPIEYDEAYRMYEVYHGKYSMGLRRNPSIHINKGRDINGDINNNRYILSKNGEFGVLKIEREKPSVLISFHCSKIQVDLNKKIFHCRNNSNIQYYDINGNNLTETEIPNIKEPRYATVGPDGYDGTKYFPKFVSKNGKVGLIQKSKEYKSNKIDTIVPTIYDAIVTDEFDKDYRPGQEVFAVKLGNKWGLIDGKNKTILPLEYENINFHLSNDFRHWAKYKWTFVVFKNKHWGIIGKKDKEDDSLTTFLPFEYDNVEYFYNDFLIVTKGGQIQVYDRNTFGLINDKLYYAIYKYEYETANGFRLFQVDNKFGQKVFVGENGVEFFKDL